jgi:hypothetical protein
VGSLIGGFPQDGPQPPILPPQDGFLFLDREKFANSFAADVEPAQAAFMADSQVPWGLEALDGAVTDPAWRSSPSWYLVVTDDRMIPPPAQRAMAERIGAQTSEVPGSHAIYVSRPAVVVDVIVQAAQKALQTAAWPNRSRRSTPSLAGRFSLAAATPSEHIPGKQRSACRALLVDRSPDAMRQHAGP